MSGRKEAFSRCLEQVDSGLDVYEHKLSRVTGPRLQRPAPPAARLRHRVQPDERPRNRPARRMFEHNPLDRPGLYRDNEGQHGNKSTHKEPANLMTSRSLDPWMLYHPRRLLLTPQSRHRVNGRRSQRGNPAGGESRHC